MNKRLSKADGWHISAANCLLRSQFPSQNGLQDTCVLKWSSSPVGFVQIIHISPALFPSSIKDLMLSYLVTSSLAGLSTSGHWACLFNKSSSEGSVDLFYSLHTVPEEHGTILSQLCTFLHTSQPSITTNVVNVGLQEGSNDCGLFAIAMAYDLCMGVNPVTRKYVQKEMRSHLHSCINNKKLKQFPGTIRNF